LQVSFSPLRKSFAAAVGRPAPASAAALPRAPAKNRVHQGHLRLDGVPPLATEPIFPLRITGSIEPSAAAKPTPFAVNNFARAQRAQHVRAVRAACLPPAMAMIIGEVIGWCHFSAIEATRERSLAVQFARASGRASPGGQGEASASAPHEVSPKLHVLRL